MLPESVGGNVAILKGTNVGKEHRAVTRITRILETVAGHPEGLTFSELAGAIDAPRSSSHALIQGLVYVGYLDQQGRTISLGQGLELLLAPLRMADVQRIAHPKMVLLAERTRETVVLSVREGSNVVHIDQVESRELIKYAAEVPRWRTLEASSGGKVFLANLPEVAWQRYVQSRIADDSNLIRTLERLSSERAEIRTRGVAYNLGDTVAGVYAVGAPIFDDSGAVIAALSVAGPQDRMQRKMTDIAAALRDVAGQISSVVGARSVSGNGQVDREGPLET